MKNNRLFIIISAIALIIVVIIGANVKPKTVEYKEDLLGINYEIKENETDLKYENENPVVAMYIEKYGSIVMELYPEVAPNTVNNFISLVENSFYDNNTFHRLVKGFVLQGGDPDGNGSGGPGYSIPGEFSENDFENNLSHTKGVISMARATAPDTAGSQFFICLEDDAKYSLDGKYAAFGKVIDGWDNIERIVNKERVADQESGKLSKNLTIKKALVDLNGYEIQEVKKVDA